MSLSRIRRAEALRSIAVTINAFHNDLDNDSPSFRLGNSRPLTLASSSLRDVRQIAIILRVLDIIHKALIDEVVVTKRDIYYRDPELFESQAVVDRVVDQVAASFNITRAALNVAAAAKGLVVGEFTIGRRDTQLLVCNSREALLIPALDEHDVLEIGHVDWILVVEKEATFSGLVSAGLTRQTDLGRGILITGKGYPDISTRSFLRRLSMSHSRSLAPPAILALVDGDPDGIAIMSTYKYGSEALSHENGDLVVPRLQWLGVKRNDLVRASSAMMVAEEATRQRGLLTMTERDRAKALAMLRKDVCAENGPEAAWRRELQSMLMTNVKAEIQLLEELPGGLMGWLRARLPGNGSVTTADESDIHIL